MILSFWKIAKAGRCPKERAFTLIELMIAMLLLSTVAIGAGTFLRNQNKTFQTGASEENARDSSRKAKKILQEDIQQSAIINPSCDGNEPAGETIIKTCAEIKIRGGIIPLPGYKRADVHNLDDLTNPSNLTATPSSLTYPSDAIRIYKYDYDGAFNCGLTTEIAINPSATDGTTSGAERFWVEPGCAFSSADVGRLFVLTEEMSTTVFANVFQITAITDQTGNTPSRIQVDLASTNSNLYNQVGGLALSGYSNEARIYPISIVEWAMEPEGTDLTAGLYRREIRPDAEDLVGKQEWELVQQNVEGVQFFPLTNSVADGPTEHQRTLQLDETDMDGDGYGDNVDRNGVEDIVGVSPRLVTKSPTPVTDGTLYDNPLTSTDEADDYPRQEEKFFAQMRNLNN